MSSAVEGASETKQTRPFDPNDVVVTADAASLKAGRAGKKAEPGVEVRTFVDPMDAFLSNDFIAESSKTVVLKRLRGGVTQSVHLDIRSIRAHEFDEITTVNTQYRKDPETGQKTQVEDTSLIMASVVGTCITNIDFTNEKLMEAYGVSKSDSTATLVRRMFTWQEIAEIANEIMILSSLGLEDEAKKS